MRAKLLLSAAAGLIIVGAALVAVRAQGSSPKEPTTKLPSATARITKATLVETKTVSGTLGYGDPVPIRDTLGGTLTWIAPIGATVKRGEPLFKVDERPVVALYGSVPLYRMLGVSAKGADVQQLEMNLVELGYPGLAVDDAYTSATAEAVRTWQADLGLPETGTIDPGQLVFTPAAVRIAGHAARVGDTITGGSEGRGSAEILSYTDTIRLVTVDLKVADQALAAKGRKVTVTVPGVGAVEGEISEIGTIATAGEEAGATPARPTSAASDARIQVTVTVTNQAAIGPLEAAPVDVDFVSEERKDVLAAPVAALLALTKGGFGLEIVDGKTTRIVPVKTGMFAAGQVEVSGEGIAEGVTVGMPSD